jgi:cytochrome c-type biogenesis protein CcmH
MSARKTVSLQSKACLLMLGLLLSSLMTPAWAVDAYTFDTPAQQQRYMHLTKTLRCPKCQNQDLADSHAPIAADLRKAIHRMLLENKTDAQIVQFMVDRYGEFVMYKPRFERSTWLLWLGPFLLAVLGVLTVIFISIRRSKIMKKETGDVLSAEDADQLKKLLAEDKE